MTDKNKLRMFLLSISFVGWFLLGIACFGFGTIFVMPYMNATFTELYLKLKGEYEINSDEQYTYSENEYEEN